MVYSLEVSGGSESRQLEKVFGERGNLQPYGRALLALTLKQRKDDKRAREVAGEIERTATTDSVSATGSRTEKRCWILPSQTTPKPRRYHFGRWPASILRARCCPRSRAGWSRIVATVTSGVLRKIRPSPSSGLIDYLKVSKELSPDYDVEVYLNGENVLTQHVSSAAASQTFSISRKADDVAGNNEIRIVKRGKGMIYFSSSLDYYTGEETVAARGSADLNLTREYFRLKVVEDGYKLKWEAEPLRGEIRSGDMLVVRLKLNGAQGAPSDD